MDIQYSEDGSVLISAKLGPDEEEVIVSDSCRVIARKAFMYQDNLKRIVLPASLERIEDFALSCTSLREVTLPASVRSIGSKAFYQCKKLSAVNLNEGLKKIGNEAFVHTSLADLFIPSTVRFLGLGFVSETPLAQQVGVPGLRISSENPFYYRDAPGGIYRHTQAGSLFIEMTSCTVKSHSIEQGVFAVARGAYMRCERLQAVQIPTGVKALGKYAFDRVETLVNVSLPESLEYIGECTFRKTSLQSLYIPQALKYIGEGALFTGKNGLSTIQDIVIDPANAYFYIENNFLIRRLPSCGNHGIVHFGLEENIVVPKRVQTVGAYCLASPHPIKTLRLHRGLTRIDPLAVAPYCHVENIVVELSHPICENTTAEIPFLDRRNFYSSTYSLFPEGMVDTAFLFSQSDRITYMSRKPYLRAKTMLNRLACPQYLSEKYHALFTEALTRKIYEVCAEFSQHEYLEGFVRLKDLGFIDELNITEIIERVRHANNAVVTSFILEMRREHFSSNNLQEEFLL